MEWVLTTKNISITISNNVIKYVGLAKGQLTFQWIYLVCDDDFAFQGHCMGVHVQIKDTLPLYLMNVHYMVHQTNLVVMVLLQMFLVSPIEAMFHVLHCFFGHNSKEYLELNMFAKILV